MSLALDNTVLPTYPWISTCGCSNHIASSLLSCVDMSAVANDLACVLMGEYKQVAQSFGSHHQERGLVARGGLHPGGEARCVRQPVGQDSALPARPHGQCHQEPLEQHHAPQGGERRLQVITSRLHVGFRVLTLTELLPSLRDRRVCCYQRHLRHTCQHALFRQCRI